MTMDIYNTFKTLFFVFSLIFMTACTYNVILTDTHGVATDIVDETSSAQADIKPNIEIPLVK